MPLYTLKTVKSYIGQAKKNIHLSDWSPDSKNLKGVYRLTDNELYRSINLPGK